MVSETIKDINFLSIMQKLLGGEHNGIHIQNTGKSIYNHNRLFLDGGWS